MSVMGWTAIALLVPGAALLVVWFSLSLIEVAMGDPKNRLPIFRWFLWLSTWVGLLLGVGAIVTRGN